MVGLDNPDSYLKTHPDILSDYLNRNESNIINNKTIVLTSVTGLFDADSSLVMRLEFAIGNHTSTIVIIIATGKKYLLSV